MHHVVRNFTTLQTPHQHDVDPLFRGSAIPKFHYCCPVTGKLTLALTLIASPRPCATDLRETYKLIYSEKFKPIADFRNRRPSNTCTSQTNASHSAVPTKVWWLNMPVSQANKQTEAHCNSSCTAKTWTVTDESHLIQLKVEAWNLHVKMMLFHGRHCILNNSYYYFCCYQWC